jgi:hypothetical protein
MAEVTLADVIKRLKEEGQLVRNTGVNSIKTTKLEFNTLISEQTEILKQILDNMVETEEKEEEKEKIAKAKKDVISDTNDITPSPEDGLLSRIFDPAIQSSRTFVLGLVAPILTPLKALFRLIRVGGPVAIVVGLLYSVFKDIGENETFQNALETIRTTWNEKIVPTFNRIREAFENLIVTDSVSNTLEFIQERWDIFRVDIQNTISNILVNLFESIGGIFDGVNLMADGNIADGIMKIGESILSGAIGFIDSIVTGILEIFGVNFGDDGSFIAWADRKLLEFWENTKEVVSGFFDSLFTSISDSISGLFSVITDLFTFNEEDMSALGILGKLTDLVYAPVNMAINFVRGMFGFEETDEPFKLQDFISEMINNIITSVKEMFSFIPSIEDLQTAMFNSLPEWMQRIIGEDTVRGSLSSDNYVNPVDEFSGLEGYRSGTKGFVDFGIGTPAMLHGMEAVVPKSTPAGQFLENNFTDNWEPIMSRISGIETAAMSSVAQAPIIVTNAPTVAPINNNVTGATNISTQRINAMGNGGSGLGRFAN